MYSSYINRFRSFLYLHFPFFWLTRRIIFSQKSQTNLLLRRTYICSNSAFQRRRLVWSLMTGFHLCSFYVLSDLCFYSLTCFGMMDLFICKEISQPCFLTFWESVMVQISLYCSPIFTVWSYMVPCVLSPGHLLFKWTWNDSLILQLL